MGKDFAEEKPTVSRPSVRNQKQMQDLGDVNVDDPGFFGKLKGIFTCAGPRDKQKSRR